MTREDSESKDGTTEEDPGSNAVRFSAEASYKHNLYVAPIIST